MENLSARSGHIIVTPYQEGNAKSESAVALLPLGSFASCGLWAGGGVRILNRKVTLGDKI